MTDDQQEKAKPCIALMGEFSAGKSTLANLLIGSDPLPVQVIATQLPPVWISYGDQPPYRMDINGTRHPIDLTNLAEASLETTMYLKIYFKEDILKSCDLLDMPGISDPNMESEVWRRMISKADSVLWCTSATQAWRQSEAAVWSEIPTEIQKCSLLLVTRMDKITSGEDRQKVIKRIKKETQGLFADCLPISLLQATSEQNDYEAWSKSGAPEFATSLAELLPKISTENSLVESCADPDDEADIQTLPCFTERLSQIKTELSEPVMAQTVVPRRVAVAKSSQRSCRGQRL